MTQTAFKRPQKAAIRNSLTSLTQKAWPNGPTASHRTQLRWQWNWIHHRVSLSFTAGAEIVFANQLHFSAILQAETTSMLAKHKMDEMRNQTAKTNKKYKFLCLIAHCKSLVVHFFAPFSDRANHVNRFPEQGSSFHSIAQLLVATKSLLLGNGRTTLSYHLQVPKCNGGRHQPIMMNPTHSGWLHYIYIIYITYIYNNYVYTLYNLHILWILPLPESRLPCGSKGTVNSVDLSRPNATQR